MYLAGEGNGTPLQYSCLANPMDGGPGGLQPMGSLRVRHDWGTSLSLFTFMHRRRKWQPTPVFLPGESQGRGSLVGCCLWCHTVRHDWSYLAAAAAMYLSVRLSTSCLNFSGCQFFKEFYQIHLSDEVSFRPCALTAWINCSLSLMLSCPPGLSLSVSWAFPSLPFCVAFPISYLPLCWFIL